jgi:DAACS family dicarboxylate/amino acid:cation (Na+ or H+) symporter
VASRFGFDLLVAIAAFVITCCWRCCCVSITLSFIIRFLIGLSPLTFFSRFRNALVTVFSTSSSSATLPTALDVVETQLGVPRRIAGFVLPIGSTMCMNGHLRGHHGDFRRRDLNVDLSLTQMITAATVGDHRGRSRRARLHSLLVGIMTMFACRAGNRHRWA